MHAEIPKALELEQKVFALDNEKGFNQIALELYHFQFANNPLYNAYCRAVNREPGKTDRVDGIPFLPISFFKSHQVRTTEFEPGLTFQSSGTTGTTTSRHLVKSALLYERSFLAGFHRFYGSPEDYCILGLLPSYLERGNSSLVYMVDRLIRDSRHPQSGFYLNDLERLAENLRQLEAAGQKTLLIGVTYALLDFARMHPLRLRHTVVMETGGMKGRGRELTRAELHETLGAALGLKEIHSEYGMTELLSQAYGSGGIFSSPPWMKALVRDETDPFALSAGGTGGLNIIDLANIYSCSFLATEDIGRLHPDGSFEVLGRLDNAEIRGCSLLSI